MRASPGLLQRLEARRQALLLPRPQVNLEAARIFMTLTPKQVRDLLLMMTDHEIEDLMLYVRLGVLCFMWELTKEPG